jgi:hypothetical protein
MSVALSTTINHFGVAYDLANSDMVIELFGAAAAMNQHSPMLHGSTVQLGSEGRVLMTGDLHDHRLNLQRILKLARLDADMNNHLIIHEVIHGNNIEDGKDMSVITLAQVAALNATYPDQVHVLLSNHELAQVTGQQLSKAGVGQTQMFHEAIRHFYGDQAGKVRYAMEQFVKSMALAIRTSNGMIACHSLPSTENLETFDTEVINRVPTEADFEQGGSAYNLVWGVKHPASVPQAISQVWGNKFFLLGHQPDPKGYRVDHDQILIIDSHHDDGTVLPIELSREYTMEQLVDSIVKLSDVKA